MTISLCLRCGELKHGALCPCQKCRAPATGDANLDIAFSDHNLAPQTLSALGGIIRQINAVENDKEIRYWAFLKYINDTMPQILRITVSPEMADKIAQNTQSLQFPSIEPIFKKRPERESLNRFDILTANASLVFFISLLILFFLLMLLRVFHLFPFS